MTELEMLKLANAGHVRMVADLAAERDRLKLDVAEARGYVFDLDEELGNAKVKIDKALKIHRPVPNLDPNLWISHIDRTPAKLVCETCRVPEDDFYEKALCVPWPCGTAKALGVTD
jgi:hypothetical protein